MATIVILVGSMLGFVTAVTAYTVFDAGLLTVLAIWIGSGPVSALLAMIPFKWSGHQSASIDQSNPAKAA
jgi:hypothetical protein